MSVHLLKAYSGLQSVFVQGQKPFPPCPRMRDSAWEDSFMTCELGKKTAQNRNISSGPNRDCFATDLTILEDLYDFQKLQENRKTQGEKKTNIIRSSKPLQSKKLKTTKIKKCLRKCSKQNKQTQKTTKLSYHVPAPGSRCSSLPPADLVSPRCLEKRSVVEKNMYPL